MGGVAHESGCDGQRAVGLRWGLLVPVLVVSAGMVLAGCEAKSRPLARGDPAPSFRLEAYGGDSLSFPRDVGGHPALLLFWTDSCPYCLEEMRDIEALFPELKKRGLSVLAINVGESHNAVDAIQANSPVSYPILFDNDSRVAQRYGIKAYPAAHLIDREGKVFRKIVGQMSPEVLMAVVKGVL